jgi:hypothetical protein
MLEIAAGWLRWRVDEIALTVISPAVIEAAQAVLLNPAIEERHASVAPVLRQQGRLAAAISEEHEILAKHADPQRVVEAEK